jgi:energy-coupling factor transport system ATP-binding protein
MLALRNLSFRYPDFGSAAEKSVLDGLSLVVPEGIMTVVLGPADAGKTTLARIIAGLVPRFSGGHLSGSVEMRGRDIGRARPFELMDRVGLVAQDSDEQLFTTRCDTEVAFALESLGTPRAELIERVERSLSIMGLSSFDSRNPATLSGGEKKRLLVACLAAIGPDLWILDESLAELDQFWRGAVLDMLRDDRRTVFVLDSRWSALLAERGGSFAVLAEGRIAATSEGPEDPGFLGPLATHGILGRSRRVDSHRASPAPFLRLENIRFQFAGSAASAFQLQVDRLEIARGEICALVGDNGSGKSTLGKTLCGLFVPRTGSISLCDAAGFRRVTPETLNGRVGYLFQNPDHQIYLPTVRDELALGLRLKGMARAEIDTRVAEAVELFALPDLSAPPALMSYGGRRRLQAATYFLLSRDLLVLDEIDSGLSTREVQRLVEALFSRRPGIILITHDLVLATSISSRIIAMDKGGIAGDYRPNDFDRVAQASGSVQR